MTDGEIIPNGGRQLVRANQHQTRAIHHIDDTGGRYRAVISANVVGIDEGGIE